jgi:tetratricopeptide (TPR) repeat protein
MRKHSFSFLVIMLAAGVLASTALAQGAGGRLRGTVMDDKGNPFEGATLILVNPAASPPRLEQMTDDRGRFTMLGIASGNWALTVEAEGYHPHSTTVTLRQGENPPFRVALARIKHPLELALGEAALEGLDPEALEAEFTAAEEAMNNQQWEQAITRYRSVLSKLPMMTNLNIQIGGALRQLGQYEEAIAAFEAAAAGDPQLEPDVETEIARTRMAMGDFDAAGSALASAADSAGATREDLYNLGELEFANGNMDAAADWYQKAAAIDPTWGKPLFKLGLVALNQGDIEAAKGLFSQVVETDPNSEEGAQARATLDALP